MFSCLVSQLGLSRNQAVFGRSPALEKTKRAEIFSISRFSGPLLGWRHG